MIFFKRGVGILALMGGWLGKGVWGGLGEHGGRVGEGLGRVGEG